MPWLKYLTDQPASIACTRAGSKKPPADRRPPAAHVVAVQARGLVDTQLGLGGEEEALVVPYSPQGHITRPAPLPPGPANLVSGSAPPPLTKKMRLRAPGLTGKAAKDTAVLVAQRQKGRASGLREAPTATSACAEWEWDERKERRRIEAPRRPRFYRRLTIGWKTRRHPVPRSRYAAKGPAHPSHSQKCHVIPLCIHAMRAAPTGGRTARTCTGSRYFSTSTACGTAGSPVTSLDLCDMAEWLGQAEVPPTSGRNRSLSSFAGASSDGGSGA
jgi:hypothetical protein